MLMTTCRAGVGGPGREHITARWLLGPPSRLLGSGGAPRKVSL